MRIVIPGGSGQLGSLLARFFAEQGHEVVVLTRRPKPSGPFREVPWDGRTVGPWIRESVGARPDRGRHACDPQGAAADGDGDGRRPGWPIRPPPAPRALRPGRAARRRRAVHVLDP